MFGFEKSTRAVGVLVEGAEETPHNDASNEWCTDEERGTAVGVEGAEETPHNNASSETRGVVYRERGTARWGLPGVKESSSRKNSPMTSPHEPSWVDWSSTWQGGGCTRGGRNVTEKSHAPLVQVTAERRR